MPRSPIYVCTQCGCQQPRWQGRCPDCGGWGTLTEEAPVVPSSQARHGGRALQASAAVPISDIPPGAEPRRPCGIEEVDRVLGGGAVPGSAILLAGDPGVGKSTLLLQVAYALTCAGHRTLYVSGEESLQQLRMRAERLRTIHEEMLVLAETGLETMLQHADLLHPAVLVVDSIQTAYDAEVDSAPGSVSQVRTSAFRLIQMAKASGCTVILVGHVTKDGQIAGPRVLEHMVDVVLALEGDRDFRYRVLRAEKNRFGSTHELGIFTMGERGLAEVSNPSAAFLGERQVGVPGSAVTAVMEGTRALLIEVQALVTPASPFGAPRRNTNGVDARRIAHILAVLEKRCGMALGAQDVFVNIPGGLRVAEPAADLAVALAIASSLRGVPVAPDIVAFGEVGLTGEVRTVSHADLRVAEAGRLGFGACLLPPGKVPAAKKAGIRAVHVPDLEAAFKEAMGR